MTRYSPLISICEHQKLCEGGTAQPMGVGGGRLVAVVVASKPMPQSSLDVGPGGSVRTSELIFVFLLCWEVLKWLGVSRCVLKNSTDQSSQFWTCGDEPCKDEAQTAIFKDPVRTAL